MGLYRNSTQVLLRYEAASDDLDSGVLAVRPSDGDSAADREQEFVMTAFADQQGAGVVRVTVLNSFGDGLWFVAGDSTLEADGAHMMKFGRMDGFAPYVRVRATATPPDGSEIKPTFRLNVRIASDGPYRLVPATVPTVVEVSPSDSGWFDDNDDEPEPPPEGP